MHKSWFFALSLLFFMGCTETSIQENTLPPTQSKSQAILDGTPVPSNQYPAVVLLMSDFGSLCTGTLITPQHVLTASHCLMNPDTHKKFGDNDITVHFGNSYPFKLQVRSKALHPHSKYNTDNAQSYDIAIIELKQAVPSSIASPMALLPPSKIITNMKFSRRLDTRKSSFHRVFHSLLCELNRRHNCSYSGLAHLLAKTTRVMSTLKCQDIAPDFSCPYAALSCVA